MIIIDTDNSSIADVQWFLFYDDIGKQFRKLLRANGKTKVKTLDGWLYIA